MIQYYLAGVDISILFMYYQLIEFSKHNHLSKFEPSESSWGSFMPASFVTTNDYSDNLHTIICSLPTSNEERFLVDFPEIIKHMLLKFLK